MNNAHIIIKNVGPIKDVDINLNQINVFMGPQSSGKSTIAKIISFCSWFEKDAIINGKQTNFLNQLIDYHELEKNYFNDNSYIEYRSNHSHIVSKGTNDDNLNIDIFVGKGNIYSNKKICYIPAERNFVTIPNIGRYNEKNNNVMGFLYDWFEAKQSPVSRLYKFYLNSLDNVNFFYDKKSDTDVLMFPTGVTINLRHSSSGLMSAIPLLVVFYRFCKDLHSIVKVPNAYYYMQKRAQLGRISPEDREEMEALLNVSEPDKFPRNKMEEILGFKHQYDHAEIIIEEPELNLFPNTQQELIYNLLLWQQQSHVGDTFGSDILTITTHSPYILFALNNCMMGGLVKDKIPHDVHFASRQSWIDPSDVSIYEIHDGTLKCIQDEDGIIEDNYLNQAYKENSAEYLSLLNYYNDEE